MQVDDDVPYFVDHPVVCFYHSSYNLPCCKSCGLGTYLTVGTEVVESWESFGYVNP